MEIRALGKSEFLLGFQLAGIKTIEAKNLVEEFTQLCNDPEVGIIITDNGTFQELPEYLREQIEAKVKPVTVVVSTESVAQETLRKKIMKSIGVDLWGKE